MNQEQLFYESPEDAIGAAIHKSGKPRKEIASSLWPHLKMDSAYARLQNSLNPTNPKVGICTDSWRP